MTPTAAGRHCAACHTEVVDFTRLTDAEMLAYLAARPGQRVCAAMPAPLVPRPTQRLPGLRRWLLALAALLGGQRLAAAPLPPLPLRLVAVLRPAMGQEQVVIRGAVLDDSLHVPVAGAYVFINDTRYGAVTDAQGEFVLSLPADWVPARQAELVLTVSAGYFTFEPQRVAVRLAGNPHPAPLTVRLKSQFGRGRITGKVALAKPPVAPPGTPAATH